MIKKLSLTSLALVLSLSLTGCGGSEEDRMINAGVEMACYTKDLQEQSQNDPEKAMELLAGMETKMDEIAKDNGFESLDDMTAAGERLIEENKDDPNYENEMDERIIEQAKDKCDFDGAAMGF